MPYDIDLTFSVFHLVERVQQTSVLLNHRRTMSLISSEIENTTIEDGARTRIFSSFQYLSRFLPQVKRYQRLAARAESVYVFGVKDVEPPPIPNVHYVYLTPQHQLAHEWFLISYGEEYASALATEELTRITDPDDQRMFKGIWTFESSIVSIMHDWLSSLVDARPQVFPNYERHYNRQIYFMTRNLGRMSTALGLVKSQIIAQEVKRAIEAQPG